MSDHAWTITVTDEQARVLNLACDTLSRLHAGQFTIAIPPLFDGLIDAQDQVRRDEFRRLLKEASIVATGLPPNASGFGVGDPRMPDAAMIAYDLHQVLRHAIAWDGRAEGDVMSYHFDRPSPYGVEPLATCERCER